MRRVSLCQFSTSRWTFHQDIIRYSTIGLDGVGIWRTKVDEVGPQEAADYLFEMKLPVSSVHWAGGFTGSEGNSYIDAVNDAIETVELAGMLGAELLIIHPGARNGHTDSHSIRLLETALNSIIPVAADYGVRLALEPMFFKSHCPWTFLNGIEDVLELISKYDPVDIGLALDLFHVGSKYVALAALPGFIDYVALVQLGDRKLAGYFDGKRCQLGHGILPINDWLERLEEGGYQGFYEIETWGVASNAAHYGDVIEGELAFAREQLAHTYHKIAQAKSKSASR